MDVRRAGRPASGKGLSPCSRCTVRLSRSDLCYRCRAILKRNPAAQVKPRATEGICPRCKRGPRWLSPKWGVCRNCVSPLKRGSTVVGSPEYKAIMRERLGDQRGAKNRGWKGGRHIDARGYVTVIVDPADAIGMAMVHARPTHREHGWTHLHEHRLVMAHALGRPLTSDEQVHHINGDKRDNRIENLKLFGSRAEHMRELHLGVCPHCGKPLR